MRHCWVTSDQGGRAGRKTVWRGDERGRCESTSPAVAARVPSRGLGRLSRATSVGQGRPRLGHPRGWPPACRREASAASVGLPRPTREGSRPCAVASPRPPQSGRLSRAASVTRESSCPRVVARPRPPQSGHLSRAGTPPPRRGECESAPRHPWCRVRRRRAARPRLRCSAWATRRRHTSGSPPAPDPARPDT